MSAPETQVIRDAIDVLKLRETRDDELLDSLALALRTHEEGRCPAAPAPCLFVQRARQILAGEL